MTDTQGLVIRTAKKYITPDSAPWSSMSTVRDDSLIVVVQVREYLLIVVN